MRDWAHSRRLGTPADEAGSVVLRQPPASKLANLFRIDISKEPSADLTRFLKTNFFARTVCETSSRQVRWYNVHHAYAGDPRRTVPSPARGASSLSGGVSRRVLSTTPRS